MIPVFFCLPMTSFIYVSVLQNVTTANSRLSGSGLTVALFFAMMSCKNFSSTCELSLVYVAAGCMKWVGVFSGKGVWR
jgi:hypothetical protein